MNKIIKEMVLLFIILFLSFNIADANIFSPETPPPLLYNSSFIFWTINPLDFINDSNVLNLNWTTINNTINFLMAANATDVWVNETGDTMSGTLDMGGNNITNVGNLNVSGETCIYNLDVNGNATFNGTFDTPCLHCEDGDVFFHGDGYFEGNVTAPNIEVMESLIVHGNSTCSGTATPCNDPMLDDPFLCGFTIYTGQRGCHWWFGSCIGTATACEDMSTATCEEQYTCSLTSDYGFIFGSDGFVGNFSLNTTGNVIADTFFSDNAIFHNITVIENITVNENIFLRPNGYNGQPIQKHSGLKWIDTGNNNDVYVGISNVWSDNYYEQRVLPQGSTSTDHASDYTNLIQGGLFYPAIALCWGQNTPCGVEMFSPSDVGVPSSNALRLYADDKSRYISFERDDLNPYNFNIKLFDQTVGGDYDNDYRGITVNRITQVNGTSEDVNFTIEGNLTAKIAIIHNMSISQNGTHYNFNTAGLGWCIGVCN